MTPAANPVKALWSLAWSEPRMINTQAAPAVVPIKGSTISKINSFVMIPPKNAASFYKLYCSSSSEMSAYSAAGTDSNRQTAKGS